MRIRPYSERDSDAFAKIHKANGLPSVCLPDFDDPLFVIRHVAEIDGEIAMGGFIRLIGEAYLLLDHTVGTPEQRWQTLQALTDCVEASARIKGLSDYSCWIPNELAKSFGPRLEELGLIKSPWTCFSKVLR